MLTKPFGATIGFNYVGDGDRDGEGDGDGEGDEGRRRYLKEDGDIEINNDPSLRH
jgi:hypothetical protein